MLRVAIKEAHEDGKDRLRAVADALVTKALTGDVPAIKEIADRLDGKVPQGIIGGEDDDPAINVRLDAERFTSAIASLFARTGESNSDGGTDAAPKG